MKYVPLAARQKMAKAMRLRPSAVPCVRTPAAPGAAKTRRFLIHWRGRAVRTSPAASPIAGAAGAVSESGTGSGRGLGAGPGRAPGRPSVVPEHRGPPHGAGQERRWVFLPLPTFPELFVRGMSKEPD